MTNDATNAVDVTDLQMAREWLIERYTAHYPSYAEQFKADVMEGRLDHQTSEFIAGLRYQRRIASRATDKKLAEALRPFAAEADNYDCVDDEGNFVPDYNDAPDESALNEINDLTVGDLRRARRILTSLEGQG